MKLQADQEQQEGNSDLGDSHDRFGIADQAKRVGADDDPAEDVAQGRAEPKLAE
jgi:hypothetical protein